jgi:hypothetical protein
MEHIILNPNDEPPADQPFVLLNERNDFLVTITAVRRDPTGALSDVSGIQQPPWPDHDAEGLDTAEALSRQIGAPLYLRRRG